ncbi:MAG: cupin domain-containing protein [Crenarchaeota archaeon]|nr:cupin domain-containing protein [Thermoproteota archaeon]
MSGVIRGPCGEKLGSYTDVEAEDATVPGGGRLEGVRIRWLVRREDGAPTFAMRLFEMEPGAVIPAHEHPWEHEIFVLDGDVEVCIEERCYQLRRGWFLYIPPNVSHSYRAGSKGAQFLCIIPHSPSVDEGWLPPCRRGRG